MNSTLSVYFWLIGIVIATVFAAIHKTDSYVLAWIICAVEAMTILLLLNAYDQERKENGKNN